MGSPTAEEINLVNMHRQLKRLVEVTDRLEQRLRILEMRDTVYTGELSTLKDDVRDVKGYSASIWKQVSATGEHVGGIIDMLRIWRKQP